GVGTPGDSDPVAAQGSPRLVEQGPALAVQSFPCLQQPAHLPQGLGRNPYGRYGTMPSAAILASRAASTRSVCRPEPRRFSSTALATRTLPAWGARVS